jgi:hypothetical protein
MAKRCFWGSLIEDKLPAIDDRAVTGSVGRACLKQLRLPARLKAADLPVFAAVPGLPIAAHAILGALALPEWCQLLLSIAAGGASVLVVLWWLKGRMLEVLPQVLRAAGRCTRCGYRVSVE